MPCSGEGAFRNELTWKRTSSQQRLAFKRYARVSPICSTFLRPSRGLYLAHRNTFHSAQDLEYVKRDYRHTLTKPAATGMDNLTGPVILRVQIGESGEPKQGLRIPGGQRETLELHPNGAGMPNGL